MKILVLNDNNTEGCNVLNKALSKVINKISFDNLGSDLLTEHLGTDFGIMDKKHKLYMLKKNLLWSDVVILVTPLTDYMSDNLSNWLLNARESFSNTSKSELSDLNKNRKIHVLTHRFDMDNNIISKLKSDLSYFSFENVNILTVEDITTDSSPIVSDNKALVSV